jgi:hypothetical protein
VVTAVECLVPGAAEQERAYLEALHDAVTAQVIGDRLEMHDAAGERDREQRFLCSYWKENEI